MGNYKVLPNLYPRLSKWVWTLDNLHMSEKLNQRKYSKISRKMSDTDTASVEQHLCQLNIKNQLTIKISKRILYFYALLISLILNVFLGRIQNSNNFFSFDGWKCFLEIKLAVFVFILCFHLHFILLFLIHLH